MSTPAPTTDRPHPPAPPGRRPTENLAIFDLDRTLLPGSSLIHLGRAMARAGLIRPATLVGFLAKEATFRRRGQREGETMTLQSRLLALATGMERDPLVALAEVVATEVATQVSPAARRVLRQHHEAGDHCVILSASPQELVEAVATQLSVAIGIGTRAKVADGRFTGDLDGPFCHSHGKLARLRDELGMVELGQSFAYSDASSDLPLLQACGYPVAVNPDRRLRAVAKAAGWPILELH
ncbi:MAG: HAD family hydrolase [Acidimicrobiales bacterium]